jgi:hypothetical protein
MKSKEKPDPDALPSGGGSWIRDEEGTPVLKERTEAAEGRAATYPKDPEAKKE